MATRVRFSRKQLKQPDQFLSTSDKILHFIEDYSRLVLVGIGALAVLVLGAWAYQFSVQSKAMEGEALLFEIQTIKESAKNKKWSEVVPQLEKKIAELNEGPQKQRARFILADSYYQSGRLEESFASYSEIVESESPDSLTHDLAKLGLAKNLHAQKKFSDAVAQYRYLLENKTSLPLLYVYLDLARCYEENSDVKNALLVLREAETKFPQHIELAKVVENIKRLQAQA